MNVFIESALIATHTEYNCSTTRETVPGVHSRRCAELALPVLSSCRRKKRRSAARVRCRRISESLALLLTSLHFHLVASLVACRLDSPVSFSWGGADGRLPRDSHLRVPRGAADLLHGPQRERDAGDVCVVCSKYMTESTKVRCWFLCCVPRLVSTMGFVSRRNHLKSIQYCSFLPWHRVGVRDCPPLPRGPPPALPATPLLAASALPPLRLYPASPRPTPSRPAPLSPRLSCAMRPTPPRLFRLWGAVRHNVH